MNDSADLGLSRERLSLLREAIAEDVRRQRCFGAVIAVARHGRIGLLEPIGHADASGRRQEVRGAGVVGEEPVLKAGESFEYTSGVPLQTPSGFMFGTYGMVTSAGEHFDIEIPAFSLDASEDKRTLN